MTRKDTEYHIYKQDPTGRKPNEFLGVCRQKLNKGDIVGKKGVRFKVHVSSCGIAMVRPLQ